MKVSELSGCDLDYYVAQVKGHEKIEVRKGVVFVYGQQPAGWADAGTRFQPSSDWCIGGPILHRAQMSIKRDTPTHYTAWVEGIPHPLMLSGATPLEAAMRCFVAAKYGDADLPTTAPETVPTEEP